MTPCETSEGGFTERSLIEVFLKDETRRRKYCSASHELKLQAVLIRNSTYRDLTEKKDRGKIDFEFPLLRCGAPFSGPVHEN